MINRHQQMDQLMHNHRMLVKNQSDIRFRNVMRSTPAQSVSIYGVPVRYGVSDFGGISRYEDRSDQEVQKDVGIASGVIGGVAGAIQTINGLRDNYEKVKKLYGFLKERFGTDELPDADESLDDTDQMIRGLADQSQARHLRTLGSMDGVDLNQLDDRTLQELSDDIEMQSVRSDIGFDSELPDPPSSLIERSGNLSDLPEPVGSIRPISSAVPQQALLPASDYDVFQGIQAERGETDQFDMPARYQSVLREYGRLSRGVQDQAVLRNMRQGLGLEQTPADRPVRMGRIARIKSTVDGFKSKVANLKNQFGQRVRDFRSNLTPPQRQSFDDFANENQIEMMDDLPQTSYEEAMGIGDRDFDSGEQLPDNDAPDVSYPADQLPPGTSYLDTPDTTPPLDDTNIGGFDDVGDLGELGGQLGGDFQLANMAEGIGTEATGALEQFANDLIPGFGQTIGRILPALEFLL